MIDLKYMWVYVFIILFFGDSYVVQAGLKTLGSRDLPATSSWAAVTTVCTTRHKTKQNKQKAYERKILQLTLKQFSQQGSFLKYWNELGGCIISYNQLGFSEMGKVRVSNKLRSLIYR